MKHTLFIKPLDITVQVEDGTLLYSVLQQYDIEFPCGGKGICGNCRVKILSGRSEADEAHRALLARKGLSDEWRLACYTRVTDDMVIELPHTGTMVVQSDVTGVKAMGEQPGYAVAVDVGSTTVVVQLLDLSDGSLLGTRTAVNPQARHGADIISRIAYAMENEENAACLTGLIRDCVKEMTDSLMAMCGVTDVRRVLLVGNTVMHHLFCGYDVSLLAAAPFQSDRNEACFFTPAQLEWNLPEMCVIEFLPNISHFVGSDILAGIRACGMAESERYSVLVDLGTNGEMVIGNCEGMWCTSTAAGPAFEGINISCGMRAVPGAISAVDCDADGYRCTTIDDLPPRGLCGSGLVEAICCLLQNETVDMSGAMSGISTDHVELAPGVELTVADVREFQLAKAAVATGLTLLLEAAGVTAEKIENVYVTGGLGNWIDSVKVKRVGLFGPLDTQYLSRIPNAALQGCKQLLADTDGKEVSSLLQRLKYCPLETNPRFQDVYCEQLFFPFE